MSLLLASIPTNIVNLQSGVSSENSFTSPATAEIQFNSNGTIDGITSSTSDKWYELAPVSGVGADYEIFATRVSGDPLTTGALDTWESLSAARSWSITQTGAGLTSGIMLIKIRDLLGNVLSEANFTIKVEVFI